jgi:UDP-N-acetylmuramate dehydrogenase
VTLRLGRGFGDIIRVDDHHIRAGAMALDVNVARFSAEWHIDGMAFLSGIPGTIGGALRMNAGAYGRELKDILVSTTVMDRTGRVFEIAAPDMNLSYRHNDLPHDFIFLSALLRGELGKEEDIQRQIADIKQKREDSQPIREKTGGSTFANPDAVDLERAGLSPDTKTWQLVDRVGGRGLCVGGAQMSEKHCNFMINTGTATATDLESLGDLIRDRVQQEFGITLRWEIKRLGEFKALAP